MNTFDHLNGNEIQSILRVDSKSDYDEDSLISSFWQLDAHSGLFIENGTKGLTTIQYITFNELLNEFEEEYQT